MEKVVKTLAERIFSKSLFIFFLFLFSACSSYGTPEGNNSWAPRPTHTPPQVRHEIESLIQNNYMSYESALWINGLLMNQCMLIEHYQGGPCAYPMLNFPPNSRDAR